MPEAGDYSEFFASRLGLCSRYFREQVGRVPAVLVFLARFARFGNAIAVGRLVRAEGGSMGYGMGGQGLADTP
jgi:hypothetical protein